MADHFVLKDLPADIESRNAISALTSSEPHSPKEQGQL